MTKVEKERLFPLKSAVEYFFPALQPGRDGIRALVFYFYS
jgi:hypothetical protein